MDDVSRPGVLIPVKELGESKTRLKPVINSSQRKKLVLALVKDMVEHVLGMKELVKPSVVTSDSQVQAYVREHDIHVISEPPGARDLGEVIDRAASDSFFSNVTGLLVFPVDLPWIDAEKLDDLVSICRNHPLVLVPDQKREGTNVLWRNPPDVIPCQYRGTTSFEAHRNAAVSAGIQPRVPEDVPTFSFDLDTPRDWERLLQQPHRLSRHLSSFMSDYLFDIKNLIRG